MKRRQNTYRVEAGIQFAYSKQSKYEIQRYVSSVLNAIGLKRGYDYTVSSNSLFIRHIKTVVGRIMISLREAFPVFNFYWETPRRLVWF